MAQLNGTFDASGVDTSNNFDALPAGEYQVIITQSEFKMTKNGSGSYLELRQEVQDGQFRGRLLFDRLNLDNSNQKAVEIAQKQLAQICHAIGVMQVSDSEQLHNRPMVAIVKVRNDPQYGTSNEVKGYKPLPGVSHQPAHPARAVQHHQAPAAPPPQASATNARPAAPWSRG